MGLFRAKSRPSHTPHQQLEEHERRRILREQIASLAENQKVALVLSQYERLSNRRIAQIMQITESAVESLLHRARENLRKKLAKYFEKNL
jgi:RNA polymerase sigma-70 factor (ECF subfamily)